MTSTNSCWSKPCLRASLQQPLPDRGRPIPHHANGRAACCVVHWQLWAHADDCVCTPFCVQDAASCVHHCHVKESKKVCTGLTAAGLCGVLVSSGGMRRLGAGSGQGTPTAAPAALPRPQPLQGQVPRGTLLRPETATQLHGAQRQHPPADQQQRLNPQQWLRSPPPATALRAVLRPATVPGPCPAAHTWQWAGVRGAAGRGTRLWRPSRPRRSPATRQFTRSTYATAWHSARRPPTA